MTSWPITSPLGSAGACGSRGDGELRRIGDQAADDAPQVVGRADQRQQVGVVALERVEQLGQVGRKLREVARAGAQEGLVLGQRRVVEADALQARRAHRGEDTVRSKRSSTRRRNPTTAPSSGSAESATRTLPNAWTPARSGPTVASQRFYQSARWRRLALRPLTSIVLSSDQPARCTACELCRQQIQACRQKLAAPNRLDRRLPFCLAVLIARSFPALPRGLEDIVRFSSRSNNAFKCTDCSPLRRHQRVSQRKQIQCDILIVMLSSS